MTRAWRTLERVATPEGALELRQRGARDFLITVGGRVLMTSVAHRSEDALAARACAALAGRARARLLLGGLGMGFTLRAALDALGADARVAVAELNPQVVQWCRGPLRALTDGAVDDPRVTVEIVDVSRAIAEAPPGAFDAIVLDLYEGPHAATQTADDPLYGAAAIARARRALRDGGTFAVWSEEADRGFEERLCAAGLIVARERAGRGGRRHVVYLARRG
jgi:spermidine synthase